MTVKAALINAPYGAASTMLPLGIASIASYANARGVPVELYDFGGATKSARELVDAYPKLSACDVVGLSFYNTNASLAFDLAEALKERNRNLFIVAGGAHPSSCPAEVLKRCPGIDAIIRGEGEDSFTSLLADEGLWRHRSVSLKVLPGIVLRDGDDVHDSGTTAKLATLDDLKAPQFEFAGAEHQSPLVFYDRQDKRVRRAVAMTTSRSCPYRCSFCAIILIGRDWRRLSVGTVVDHFNELNQRHGPLEHVYFMDANFFVRPERTVAIAEALQATSVRPTFSFSTRANQLVRGSDHIRRLKELGLRAVEIGIESASPEALKRFAKDTTPDDNSGALDLLAELGIHLILDFIMFDAEAKLSDLMANLAFLEKHGLDSYLPWDHLFSHLTPYHGTPIRRRYEQDLGLVLPVHELPEPRLLLLDAQVRHVFGQICRLLPALPGLHSAVVSNDRLALAARDPRVRARAALNGVSLRRLPYVTLRNLVVSAAAGTSMQLEDAVPKFWQDAGNEVPMPRFLDEVAAA